MKIDTIASWAVDVPLTRPYTVAFGTCDAVPIVFVRIEAEGWVGRGSASPAEDITGETAAACQAALTANELSWLVGEDTRDMQRLANALALRMAGTPAARAAVDMALHDLGAQALGVPLCAALGKHHDALLTSVTIGIKDADAALEEADEYLGRGFRALKVKIGTDVEEDIERVRRLRSHVGDGVAIRVDANAGYDVPDTVRLLAVARELGIELVEQPLPAAALAETRSLPDKDLVCLDESVLDVRDARAVLDPPAAGSINVKLMKCGGIAEARQIASLADAHGVGLMWGCMDESRVSIAAALHVALASPATRYLDLDGHLDLASDPFDGGFVLREGVMRPTDRPGLGVTEG